MGEKAWCEYSALQPGKEPAAVPEYARHQGLPEHVRNGVLPATLLDGQLVMAGKLPSREDIARWAGISLTQDWNEDSTQPRCCSIPRMP